MEKWNASNPSHWARACRLVAVPYFGMRRSSMYGGNHVMMQDGDSASFAFHSLTDGSAPSADILKWAWSSNVRHAVVFDERSHNVFVHRWDSPSLIDEMHISSESDAQRLLRHIERSSQFRPTSPDVVQSLLHTFVAVRSAIECRGGNDFDALAAFNAALILARYVDDMPPRLPHHLTLSGAIKLFRNIGGFRTIVPSVAVKSYNVGELARLVLDDGRHGAPYVLDVDLLVRHASGLLYQEAHRRLSREFKRPVQRTIEFDALTGVEFTDREEPQSFIHYTPPWLARALVELASREHSGGQARRALDILDPSCGSGVFLIEAAREFSKDGVRNELHLRGMEISSVAGVMADFAVDQARTDSGSHITYSIVSGTDSLSADWGIPDIILMNPPFVAWKDLSQDERLSLQEVLPPEYGGRPDYFLGFLYKAAMTLPDGGVLAAVVPASFLTSKSAIQLRSRFHSKDFRVRVVGHLHGKSTFENAMVEAAFIVVEKSPTAKPVQMVVAQRGHAEKAVRWLRGSASSTPVSRSGFEIYSLDSDRLQQQSWVPLPQIYRKLNISVTENTTTVVQDFFTVRLGVRGVGARGIGKILTIKDEDYDRFAPTTREQQYFRPMADHIVDGQIEPSGYVFYPYDSETRRLLISSEDQLSKEVPAFYREVLLPAKGALKSRKSINRRLNSEANRQWWEPSEPVTTWLAARHGRIVSQEFGKRGNFAFDPRGEYAVVGGNGWCWNAGPIPSETAYGYLAILNSRVFERLLCIYCPDLQGGQRRLEGRFVHNIPLPPPDRLSARLKTFGLRMLHQATINYDRLDAAVLAAYGVGNDVRRSIERESKSNKHRQFQVLARRWRSETEHLSRPTHRAANPAYQKIIAMGRDAVGFILKDLKKHGPDDWFIALSLITGENPITENVAGYMAGMTEAWLTWGKTHGYLKD